MSIYHFLDSTNLPDLTLERGTNQSKVFIKTGEEFNFFTEKYEPIGFWIEIPTNEDIFGAIASIKNKLKLLQNDILSQSNGRN